MNPNPNIDFSYRYKTSNYLKNCGWEFGKGLGKEEQGLTSFIHPEKRAGTEGLKSREKPLEEFWWEKLYNQTAQTNNSATKITNLHVPSGDLDSIKDQTTKSTKSSISYGGLRFVIAEEEEEKEEAMIENPSNSSDNNNPNNNNNEMEKGVFLDVNTLFATCQGRRLNPSSQAKLRRVEEQEKKFLEMKLRVAEAGLAKAHKPMQTVLKKMAAHDELSKKQKKRHKEKKSSHATDFHEKKQKSDKKKKKKEKKSKKQ